MTRLLETLHLQYGAEKLVEVVRDTGDRIKVLLDEVSVHDIWALLIDLKEKLKRRGGDANGEHLGIVQRWIQNIKDLVQTNTLDDKGEGP